MIGVSDAFRQTVVGSHTAIVKVNVIQHGQVVMVLPVITGEVSADRTAAQMRQCTLGFADPDGTLTPTSPSSVFAPFGTQFQVFRGVLIPGVALLTALDNSVITWSTGTNNGTVASATDGALILGYGS